MRVAARNYPPSASGIRAPHAWPVRANGIRVLRLISVLPAITWGAGCGLTGASHATNPSSTNTPAPAALSVSPPSVGFGSVPMGSVVSQSVTLRNIGGSTLTVTQVSTTASGFSVTGVSLPLQIGAGGQSNFTIDFSPKQLGAVTGGVSILSDASASQSNVTVSGTGIAATALVVPSASSLNFGSVSVGGKKSLNIRLTNEGNSNVTISGVQVSGPPYSASGVSSGLVLTPSQSATLDVDFSPQTSGMSSGMVILTSDATDSPTNISVSGTGAVLHTVSLIWVPSISIVAGYNVYRSDVSGGPYAKLNSPVLAADIYADPTALGGQTYYYVVTAVAASGLESADSAQASVTIPSP